MKSIKLLILGFLLVIAMSFVNAVSINQESKTITEQDSLYFEASGENIVYYEWDFNGVLPEKTVDGRYIFFTSTVHDGKFGNTEEQSLANADKMCNDALRAAGIPGTCKAILSTSTISAIGNRIPESNEGYYNILGDKIADNKADLTSTTPIGGMEQQLKAGIVNEFGEVSGNEHIWTGSDGYLRITNINGNIGAYTCNNWRSNGNSGGNGADLINNGAVGYTEKILYYPYPWSRYTRSCHEKNHIYGVQDENPIKIYEGTKIRIKKIGSVQFNIPSEYTINLKGYKEDGSYESDSIVITVLENQAPVLTINEQVFNENQKVIFPVIAEDPESDILTFSIETSIVGYSFNTKTDSCIGQEDIDIINNYYYDNPARYDSRIDFNNDNTIDILDIMKITDIFGACKGDENYNAKYDLSNKIRIFSWQTNYLNAGTYTVKFAVIDARGKSNSKTVTITINDVNRIPSKPILVIPVNNAENIPINAKLTWQKSADADNDIVTYKVYFGQELALVSTQSELSYDPPILDYEKTYYWKIIASDGKDSIESDVWKFKTRKENTPPNAPTGLNPANNAQNVEINAQLSWSPVIDADGDDVTYKVYFAKVNEEFQAFAREVTNFYPQLTYETEYKWKVAATDGKDDSSPSATYTFKTRKANTHPVISGLPDQEYNEDTGFLDNIINLAQYSSDAESSSLTYSIKSQSHTEIINCWIDENNVDCQTKPNAYGNSDITIEVSDEELLTATDIFTIKINSVNDIPTADIVNQDTIIVVGNTINFQGQGNDVEGSVSYSWDFDESNGIQAESTMQNPSKLFNTIGTFKVTLTIKDSDSATATDKITVTVTDITGNHVPVINSFTPTNTNILIGDNVNLQFTTTSSDFENNIKSKIWYVDDIQEGTGDSFTFNKAIAKTYIIKFVVTDIANLNATKTWTVVVSTVPVTNNYNIPQLSGNLDNVANFYVNKEQYGKIDFLQALDLRDVVDLDNNIIIGDGIVGINTAVYPQLNRQATITMKGLTFTETPTIYYTTGFTANINEINTVCNFCSNISYSNGILTFKVDHFTTFAVKQVSKLIIEDLDVKVDDKTDSNVLNGETINQEARPGSTVTLSLDIRNNLGKDINDITVMGTLKAIDDGEDIEEESNNFDLDSGKKKSETIKFDIPYKVDEGSYELEIHVEGEDEDSKLQQTDWTIKLIVNKKSHEIVISKADLGNELLECVRTTNLNIELLNTGNEDEDDVKIVVKSDDLGIDFEQDNIELTNDVFSDDSKYAKTIRIQVSNDFNEGIYPITVEVYRNNNLEASKELSLQVGICQVKEVAQAEKGISIVSENKVVPKVKAAEKTGDIELIAALIGGIFVVLVLIIAALFFGFRKK